MLNPLVKFALAELPEISPVNLLPVTRNPSPPRLPDDVLLVMSPTNVVEVMRNPPRVLPSAVLDDMSPSNEATEMSAPCPVLLRNLFPNTSPINEVPPIVSPLPAHQLLPKAAHLTWEEAAAPTLVGTTAYRMLFGWEGNVLKDSDVVLVWGGSGGLGRHCSR